jgi:hypothetical protein
MLDWFDGRRRTRTCLAALAAAVPILIGCFPLGASHATKLRSTAAPLVPPGSHVIEQSLTDCVEFESSPSCRLIYFVAPRRPTNSLARALQKTAEKAGWSLTRKDVYQGGTELRLRRRGLRAYISLAAGTRAKACRHRPRKDCASLVDVSAD